MNSALIAFDKRTDHRISNKASILKISCMQMSIYCMFSLVLRDPIGKVQVQHFFRFRQ